MRRRGASLLAWLCLGLCVPGPAAGQRADSLVARSDGPFLTRADGYLVGGFAAAAVGVAFADRSIARALRDPELQESVALRRGAALFRDFAEPGMPVLAVAVYATGRFIVHDRRVAALGLRTAESMLLGGTVIGALKGVAGRARPYARGDSVPSDFGLGRGFRGSEYRSFPSGHTGIAFAAASVATAEFGRLRAERGWPRGWAWLVGGVMYGGAGLAGVSRIYHDQHWASDVVAGAAIGTLSGLAVVRYHDRHPDGRLERGLVGVRVLPAPDGSLALAASLPAPR